MDLRFRQVHLDFHTSQHITGIGDAFDPDEFGDTLQRAHVNSITCFARCHHGYIYYDTRVNPERRHPHLKRNLLAEQIEACHKRDIRVPIYTTIQWDHFTAEQHPEWLALDADGKVQGTPPYEAGFYRNLCVNSPYLDFLKAHVTEILQTFEVDGFFFDIVNALDDSSVWTRSAMQAVGLDPADQRRRVEFGRKVIDEFKHDLSVLVRSYRKDCSIFYNAGHISPFVRPGLEAYSHLELESLPSAGQWGYLHYPLTVRYARTLGLDNLGMTGKFHTSWGDFHSFKNPAALQYECFRMLALNSKCSVGDQLHPDGKICQDTYNLIGSVYRDVERKEPWCVGASPLVDIGLLNTEEFSHSRIPIDSSGAVMMLQETGHQFDVLDTHSDFAAYRVLVLPDSVSLDDKLAEKIRAYLAGGGALIASYRSGLLPDESGFALPEMGVRLVGEAPFSPDFLEPSDRIGARLPQTELVVYRRGLQVEALPGAEVLAQVNVPYFNRDFRHFCSHLHTPSSRQVGYPGIIKNGQAIYFAHPIFSQYRERAPRWLRILFHDALSILLPQPLVRALGPSTLQTTLNEQPALKRRVLHLLHYIPERRGMEFDTLEDVIPLYNTAVSVRADQPVQSVRLVPEGMELAFTSENGRVEFIVPVIAGHQMIEIA
ncbi:MAG TPA: beta-galactosidase trimerization domain-containing protein [Anaerolinea sp.]|nr:beta-galactosidase trimerization domain-containing protein [Anaerolinea sp.]